jgi:hypothetical protein
MRRTSLQELHHLLDRKTSGKIDQRVHMIEIHEIDFHVHGLLIGVFNEVLG